MTLKIPMHETVKLVGSSRYRGNDIAESMVMDGKIYVAVTGKDLESKSSLVWAIQNSGGKEFCIFHVHKISVQGHDMKLRLYNKEKKKAHKCLDKYLNICRQMQVIGEKIYIETDSVEKGILQLISERGVRILVMGAAADRHCSMRMKDLQSKKAIYICREAPDTCHIWFTCKGYLFCSREARRRANLCLECSSSSSLSQSEITRGTESVPSSSIVIKDDDQIKLAFSETENSKREIRFNAYKHEEAEKSAFNETKRATQSENAYFEELKSRKETEKAQRNAKEELEKMRSEAETLINESNMVIRKLQEKYSLSMKTLRSLREEKEKLKIELKEVSKLMNNRKYNELPQYFICPITQDVMEDPQVAADGFTYEGEAIRGWFERGHETSPMTNKTLPHTILVPNLALRSAIQEWLQASAS